jgi:nucleoid-associated protein YgaU
LLVGAVALMVAGSAHIGTSLAATSAQERVRAEAEAIAEAASKEFNTFIERQRVAQANPQKPQGPVLGTGETGLLDWFQNSGRRFQRLMRQLAGERSTVPPWDPVADATKRVPAGGTPPTVAGAMPQPAKSEPATKPVAETPKRTEVKPGATEKRELDVRAAKPASKADQPPKPMEGKAKAPHSPSPASKPSDVTPGKAAGAPDGPAMEAAKPRVSAVGDGKPVATAKPADAKGQTVAPSSAPLSTKSEAAREPAQAGKTQPPAAKGPEAGKQPETPSEVVTRDVARGEPPSDKLAMVKAPPPSREAERPPRRIKSKTRAARPPTACRRAGRLNNGWYTVERGDSLWRIAKRHLGSGARYRAIHAANRRRVADPDLIRACQRIYIPVRGARRRG